MWQRIGSGSPSEPYTPIEASSVRTAEDPASLSNACAAARVNLWPRPNGIRELAAARNRRSGVATPWSSGDSRYRTDSPGVRD